MRAILASVVTLLLMPTLIVGASPPADAPLPAEFEDLVALASERLGIAVDPRDVQVVRQTSSVDGVTTASVVDTAGWAAEMAPMLRALAEGEGNAAPPVVPSVTVGGVYHLMVQLFVCSGYDDAQVAEDVRTVEGSWDFGFHLVPGAAGGGVDTADLAASLQEATAREDFSVVGAGQVAVIEDYLYIFGICLATIGQFQGAGVFWFDPAALPIQPTA